jgi:hypothetical protein
MREHRESCSIELSSLFSIRRTSDAGSLYHRSQQGVIMKFSNSWSFLSTLLLLIFISLIASPVFATNYGAGAQLALGAVQAGSSSSTTGGSQFSVSVNSNGKAAGYAVSTGGGVAQAGGTLSNSGVTTFTNNSSYSTGDAKSNVRGSATGTGSAAQGTDTNSAATGQFGKVGAFGNFSFGGFSH